MGARDLVWGLANSTFMDENAIVKTRGDWLVMLAYSIRDGATLTGDECEELYNLLKEKSARELVRENLMQALLEQHAEDEAKRKMK